MIIDFHTHIFPDKIAEKTIESLSQKANIPAYADGTLSGLNKALESAGVDVGISLPVLTRPQSFDGVLRFATQINEGFAKGEHRVLSFAGIHPDCEEIEEKLALIKSSGIKGIKIHPEYQQTYIDDERYIRIFNAAAKEDLIVVTHSGEDAGYPDSLHCTPKRVLNALEKVEKPFKFVLAHMGACGMYNEVYELLAGKDVYLDTAYVLESMDKGVFLKILEKHGADRILFASDSPWQSIAKTLEYFSNLGVSDEDKEKILYKNAEKLLK